MYNPSMFTIFAVACAVDELYPPAYLADHCPGVTCRTLVGDADGLIEDSLGYLAMADPWFGDMVVANIHEVVFDEPRWWNTPGAPAWYDHGTLRVLRPEVFTADWIGASIVVHEAGHGRPLADYHLPCSNGIVRCDRDGEGAVGVELMYLMSLPEELEDPLVDPFIQDAYRRILWR